MAIAKEIRLKIHSIKNTQKITKAMEMVAASKMRKTQDRMHAAIPYAKKIMEVIKHVASGNAEYRHPYMEKREFKRVGYIIVTTDRGLCGGLNSNLLKATLKQIKKDLDSGLEVDLCLIGGKGLAFFKRMGGNVIAHKRDIGDKPNLMDLIGIVKVMLDAYNEKRIDALYLCSNEFVSTMRQEPRIQRILPVAPDEPEIEEGGHSAHWDYIYEPDDAPQLLGTLLTRYIESQVYRAVVENIASEQAARMLAMRNATDNASELIASLQLAYNKARQAAITRELSEIVAGASVL